MMRCRAQGGRLAADEGGRHRDGGEDEGASDGESVVEPGGERDGGPVAGVQQG